MDEPWEDGMITIKEEKEVYQMLSVHLCGGQFKRKCTVPCCGRMCASIISMR